MKFSIVAMDEGNADVIAAEIEADTFEDALGELRRRAQERWPGQIWRPTCVAENPSRGPISMVVDFTKPGGNDQ